MNLLKKKLNPDNIFHSENPPPIISTIAIKTQQQKQTETSFSSPFLKQKYHDLVKQQRKKEER